MLLEDREILSICNQVKSFSVCNNIKYLPFITDFLRNVSMTLSTCVIRQLSGEFVMIMFHHLK